MGRQRSKTKPKTKAKPAHKRQQGPSEGKRRIYLQSWIQSVNAVLKAHNGYTADGKKVCSYATQAKRKADIMQGLRELKKMGFQFKDVHAIKGKHIKALVVFWKESGLSASTIQNRLSNWRTFACWLGKAGMVRDISYYLGNEHSLKRTYSATVSRSWQEQGIDTTNKIEAVRGENRRFGDALALQLLFGLRSKESLLLKPHLADKGNVLIVEHGTKGGRTRYVEIKTEAQRQLLDGIKSYLSQSDSLVPKEQTYVQCRNRYYYVLRKHNIKRDQGITAHGLRHEHMETLYAEVTGHKPAVSGGMLHKTDKALDSFARTLVAERAGHARESISTAYLGSKQTKGE